MRRVALSLLALAACSNGGDASPDAADAAIDGVADVADAAEATDAAPPPTCPAVSRFDPATAPEIVVAGDAPTMGIFDPSIVYPAGAAAGAMAYSAVPDQETIRTHVALSVDHGATWTFAVEANAPEPATIPSTNATECPGGSCSGALISEVTSLIDDADEPDPSKRWKLFAHRYLVGAGVALHYTLGTIALQTAPDPKGPWTPPQKWIGWPSKFSDYSSTGVVSNVGAMPAMADCVLLTEPGALWRPGALDLAVGCAYVEGAAIAIRIELLRSTDHAASWSHVATLLRPSDAGCVAGATGLNAADLFVSGGVEYLSATPGDATGAYEGCLSFVIADPVAGTIARDDKGQPIAARILAPVAPQFDGACTFADGAGGWALDVGFGLGDPSVTRKFRILRPGIATP